MHPRRDGLRFARDNDLPAMVVGAEYPLQGVLSFSVLETARRRAVDPLTAIRLTLSHLPLHTQTWAITRALMAQRGVIILKPSV